ncbi:hypothetical protein F5H01DRAFT_202903 [Linnemannia elongata]|nr:hypothetical protein F5H01DRAFT_202903 [Linnemannia elongata]
MLPIPNAHVHLILLSFFTFCYIPLFSPQLCTISFFCCSFCSVNSAAPSFAMASTKKKHTYFKRY